MSRKTSLFSLVLLLVIPGMCTEKWGVQYTKTYICALKGSTILLSGTYKHPEGLSVTEIFWTLNPVLGKADNLLDLQDYKGRVVNFTNKNQTFAVKLSDVTHNDGGMYCLRIETNIEIQKFLGFPGIQLRVTELSVEIPEEVVEKNSSVLLCKTTCILTSRAGFTWYKNGKPLPESISTDQLLLQSVSSDDAGNYSCAVRDQKHLPSPAVTLNVRYPPRSVSVSVSPSGEIMEGDSVTLSCSSDSNPPALNFSWFKEDQTSSVGSGQSFSISSFNSSHSGRFYCEAHNQYGSNRSASVSLCRILSPSAGGLKTTLYAATAVGAAFICICTMVVVVKIISRKSGVSGCQGGVSKQEVNSSAVADPSDSNAAVQNDVMYSAVIRHRPERRQTAGDDDEVQYATVNHLRNTERTSVDRCPADSVRSDDSSVIYSSINVA